MQIMESDHLHSILNWSKVSPQSGWLCTSAPHKIKKEKQATNISKQKSNASPNIASTSGFLGFCCGF